MFLIEAFSEECVEYPLQPLLIKTDTIEKVYEYLANCCKTTTKESKSSAIINELMNWITFIQICKAANVELKESFEDNNLEILNHFINDKWNKFSINKEDIDKETIKTIVNISTADLYYHGARSGIALYCWNYTHSCKITITEIEGIEI